MPNSSHCEPTIADVNTISGRARVAILSEPAAKMRSPCRNAVTRAATASAASAAASQVNGTAVNTPTTVNAKLTTAQP